MASTYQVVVLGAAESGVGAALLAKSKGLSVWVSDAGEIKSVYKDTLEAAGIAFEERQHTESIVLSAKVIVKSPGIPDKAALVKKAIEQGISVISEIEFAARNTKKPTIAITGSNGKTTTTLLTHHLISTYVPNTVMAGNVGNSFAAEVVEDKASRYVLEVSSFQLDGTQQFKPDVAVITNITPDHLDRYEYVFQNYVNSKFKVIQNADANTFFLYFDDGGVVAEEIAKRKIKAKCLKISLENPVEYGAWLHDEIMHFRLPIKGVPVESRTFGILTQDIALKGSHNYLNAMFAVICAVLSNVPVWHIRAALKTFVNAPHRLQEVAEIKGVKWVNDSKATNVDSVKYALGSFNQPIVLIAGGVDKGNDYSLIADLVKENVKALVCMGTDNSPLLNYFKDKLPIADTHSLADAVKAAQDFAVSGDIVLLSPACASFDLFKNYEDRGNQFMQAVKNLAIDN